MTHTIRDAELDRAARDLKAARDHMRRVLVLCSGYVDVRAAEGDLRAKDLARLVASSHDQLTLTGINAETLKRCYE